ncbi:MAG: transcriptional antiterminator, Rof [Sulfurimicrobium sp.]
MLDYQPISCAQHEHLEFSVLRKIPLLLEYREGAEKFRHTVLPLDVATRNGAEWLKFKKLGDEAVAEIRLDAIISFAEARRS